MKIRFKQNTRLVVMNATGQERLVDYYEGALVDVVDVKSDDDGNATILFTNADLGFELKTDVLEVVEEKLQIPVVEPLTNAEPTV